MLAISSRKLVNLSSSIDELKNLLFHNNEAKAATSSPDFKAGITLSITSDKHMRVKK